MPFLDQDGTRIPLGADTTIGSGAQANHRIQGQDLAARHFTVRIESNGAATIAPTGDASIVSVDGVQVPRSGTTLRDGAVIAAGQARFVFAAGDQAPRGAAPATAVPAYLIDTTARRAYELGGRTIQIGRDAGAGIVLKDPTVSRFHADVRGEAGGHALYSSGATGTFLNEEPVSAPRLLRDNDEIRVGRLTLVYTRTVPPGLKVVPPAGGEESAATRRSTVVDMKALNERTRDLGGGGGSRPIIPIVVGLLVVILVVLGLMFM